jgi:hypothetical protein
MPLIVTADIVMWQYGMATLGLYWEAAKPLEQIIYL